MKEGEIMGNGRWEVGKAQGRQLLKENNNHLKFHASFGQVLA